MAFGLIGPVITGGVIAAPFIFRAGARLFGGLARGGGPGVLRSAQVSRPALTGAGLFATGVVGDVAISAGLQQLTGGRGMAPAGAGQAGIQGEIPDVSLAPGAGVVGPLFVPVKFWRAGAALFALDTLGKRWVWIPTQGRWKKVKVVRNIVISGKDITRARRLIRTSRRLQTIRHQLGTYSKHKKRKK